MIIAPAHRLGKVKTYYFANKLAEIDKMNQESAPKVINLGIGSPDLLPPDEAMHTITSSIEKEGAHQYQSYRGIPALRQAFSQWYQRHFNVVLDPGREILSLIGSKEGIMHISMSFINSGDKVLVPDPGYPAYTAITELCEGEVVPYALSESNNWWPDIHQLAKINLSGVKIMWINYPHMPTGAKGDLSMFEELVAFAKEKNILLCHDNPYTFILNDKPLSIFQVKGAKDVALELTSLSKNYNMAGWRVGALAGSAGYLDTILTFKSNMDSGMFKPIQEAAVTALDQGESWHRVMNTTYEKRRTLAHHIMDVLKCSYDENAAGLFVWGRIPESIESSDQICDRFLYQSRVFITPGHIFGKNGSRYIRISLCADEEALNEALSRINSTIKQQKA